MKNIIRTDEERKVIFERICYNVINNKMSFNQAVALEDITNMTFFTWLVKNDEFKTLYNYAREIRSDILFEEIIETASTTEEGEETKQGYNEKNGEYREVKRGDMTNHRRLKIDALKWVVSRMNPKKYGDKLDVTTDGEKISNNLDYSKLSTETILKIQQELKEAENKEK